MKLTPELIDRRMTELDMSNAELGRLTGAGRMTVGNWRKPGGTSPAGKYYDSVMYNLKLTYNQIGDIVPVNKSNIVKTKTLPIIDYIQAGNITEISDIKEPLGYFEVPVELMTHGDKYYLLKVKGDSMFNPTDPRSLNEGDIVLVEIDTPPIDKKYYVIGINNDGAAIKKYVTKPEGDMFVSINPKYTDPNSDDYKKYNFDKTSGSIKLIGQAIHKFIYQPL